MDTTNSSENQQRRVEDRKPVEVIDWAAPGAPAVPLSPAATSGTDEFMVYGRAGNRRADLEAKLRDALAASTPGPAATSGDAPTSRYVLAEHEIGGIIGYWNQTSNSRYELCRAVETAVLARIKHAAAPSTASGDELPPSVLDERRAFAEWFNGTMYRADAEEAMCIGWQARAAVSAATKPAAHSVDLGGRALNDAGWALVEALPHDSLTANGFNNLKPALRVAIEKYLSLVATKPAAAAPEGWEIKVLEDGGFVVQRNIGKACFCTLGEQYNSSVEASVFTKFITAMLAATPTHSSEAGDA